MSSLTMTAAPWKRRRGSISSVIRAIQPASSAKIRKCRPVRKPSIFWLCRQRWTTCPVICGRLRKARPSIPSGGLSMTGPGSMAGAIRLSAPCRACSTRTCPSPCRRRWSAACSLPMGLCGGRSRSLSSTAAVPLLTIPATAWGWKNGRAISFPPPTWACWSMGPCASSGKNCSANRSSGMTSRTVKSRLSAARQRMNWPHRSSTISSCPMPISPRSRNGSSRP